MKVSKPVLGQAPCISYVNGLVWGLGRDSLCPCLELSFPSNMVPAVEGNLNPQAAPDPCIPSPRTSLVPKGPTSCHKARLASAAVSTSSQSLFTALWETVSWESGNQPSVSREHKHPKLQERGLLAPPTLAPRRAPEPARVSG